MESVPLRLYGGSERMRRSFWRWNLLQSSRLALPSSGERAALVKKKKGAFMRKRVKASFDPKVFLAKVCEGKTISKYRTDQIVFSQGQVADSVFYVQQGKVKLTVVSEQGKEAVARDRRSESPRWVTRAKSACF